MGIYEDYAAVYDASGQLAFSLRMIPYLQDILQKHRVSGKTMLDLACGTGTTAIGFAQTGWGVWGVDGSPHMVERARAKAKELGVDVQWSCQDMRRFVVPQRVSLLTCLYDSMNYMLRSEDLSAVFRRAYETLDGGGLFCFDMNTAHDLATLWNDSTYYTDSNDLSVVMQSRYDERRQRSTVTVTCFQRCEVRDSNHADGQPLYRKIVEHHTEQAYPREHIATLLVDAGFALEASYRCFTFARPDDTTMRIMWVARRPASGAPGSSRS